jgi:hypothetical protein
VGKASFRLPFEDKTPITLELHHQKVQVNNAISVIVPLCLGVNPNALDVRVPRNGKSLVVSLDKGFPSSFWDSNKLYDSSDDEDAHVWKGAFSQTHLTKPCQTKASYVINLDTRVDLIKRSGISVKGKDFFLIVELEEIS